MTDPQLFTTAITPVGVEHLRAAIEKEGGPQVSDPSKGHEFKVTDAGNYTAVALPDGNLRIFEPTEESDDASRMYVLDVLGMSVLLRWTDVRKGENGNDDWTEEDGPPHALRVVVDSDCDSIRPFTGELEVSNGLDTQDWGVIEADEVQPA